MTIDSKLYIQILGCIVLHVQKKNCVYIYYLLYSMRFTEVLFCYIQGFDYTNMIYLSIDLLLIFEIFL